MNDRPHLIAIIESKIAQVRTNVQNNNMAKVRALLDEIKIYTEAL